MHVIDLFEQISPFKFPLIFSCKIFFKYLTQELLVQINSLLIFTDKIEKRSKKLKMPLFRI